MGKERRAGGRRSVVDGIESRLVRHIKCLSLIKIACFGTTHAGCSIAM